MKKLKNSIILALITALMVIGTLMATAQPPQYVYQTGANPTFVILQGYKDGFSNVAIEAGDYICSYFQSAGKNYIVGAKPIVSGKGTNLVAFLNYKEDVSMPDTVLSGAPAGDEIYLCLYRAGKYYDVMPAGEIILYSNEDKQVSSIKALPLTIYVVANITINLSKTIELSETTYLTWKAKQCPVLPVGVGEFVNKSVQIHFYSKGKLAHEDGRVWETNKRGTISEFNLTYPFTKFARDIVTTNIDADGTVNKTTYTTSYKLKQTDIKRGYVTFKLEAVKYAGCSQQDNPYYYLRYQFDTLPQPTNPLVLIKEADPLPPPGYVSVKFDYDRVVADGAYWKLVVKGNEIYIVNHLNYSMSIEIREPGATRMIVGSGVTKASARLLPLNVNDKKLVGKTLQIKVTSWQTGLDETKQFTYK